MISSGVVYFIGQIILWKTSRAEHTSKKTSRKRQQKRTIIHSETSVESVNYSIHEPVSSKVNQQGEIVERFHQEEC